MDPDSLSRINYSHLSVCSFYHPLYHCLRSVNNTRIQICIISRKHYARFYELDSHDDKDSPSVRKTRTSQHSDVSDANFNSELFIRLSRLLLIHPYYATGFSGGPIPPLV